MHFHVNFLVVLLQNTVTLPKLTRLQVFPDELPHLLGAHGSVPAAGDVIGVPALGQDGVHSVLDGGCASVGQVEGVACNIMATDRMVAMGLALS